MNIFFQNNKTGFEEFCCMSTSYKRGWEAARDDFPCINSRLDCTAYW